MTKYPNTLKSRIDFHIHSCLSPCAALEMSPRAIVSAAKAAGLGCIALTDHGCVENLPAFHEACAEADMPCLYGMEATSSEEVHTLCLFDRLEPAMDFGRMIYDAIVPSFPGIENARQQPIVDVEGTVTGFAKKLLVAPTSISFFNLVPMALEAGALCIPSHIDRDYAGAVAQLGFLPDLPYDAVEVLSRTPPGAEKWPVVQSSDSHHPSHIGRRMTQIETGGFSVPELRKALHRLL